MTPLIKNMLPLYRQRNDDDNGEGCGYYIIFLNILCSSLLISPHFTQFYNL
jgi:hypothetical protein